MNFLEGCAIFHVCVMMKMSLKTCKQKPSQRNIKTRKIYGEMQNICMDSSRNRCVSKFVWLIDCLIENEEERERERVCSCRLVICGWSFILKLCEIYSPGARHAS